MAWKTGLLDPFATRKDAIKISVSYREQPILSQTLSDHSQNVGQIKTQPIMRFFRSPLRQIPQREWLSSQNVRESVRSHCFDYPDFKSKPVDVR